MRSPGPAPADADASGDRLVLSARPALAVVLIGVALALTGFAVAGPTVAVPGAGLIVLGGLAPVWVLAVTAGLHVDAWAPSRTVTDGQPLGIEITVTGPSRLVRGGAELQHELLDAPVRLTRAGRVHIDVRASGRGELAIAAPHVVVSDPLGLARATRGARSTVGTLLVLPRTEPVRWLDASAAPAGTGAPAGLRAGPLTIDIAGLRGYQPGTPATRIHWPALARGGGLLERVFATETERAPLLAVDPRCADPEGDRHELDLVIRAAASLALALARGGTVDLLLPGRAAPLRITESLSTWPSVLRALALLMPAPLSAAAPRAPAGDTGVLYYACTDPALAPDPRHRWAGRLLVLAPPFAGASAPGELTPASPVPGAPGQAAVLEVAGCVARPVWGSPWA